jgi:GAF domain-containing protein
VPLPAIALGDVQAFGFALQAADVWRRERRSLAAKIASWTERAEAVKDLAIALTAERDPQELLTLILSRAREFIPADAGSLYLVQQDQCGQAYLRFALAQNDSVQAFWQENSLPLQPTSIAGAVAQLNHVVNVEDVYDLSSSHPFHHNASFDTQFGYRTRSVVGIPLVKHDGEMLGVLQLMNRKPLPGVPLEEPMYAAEVMPFSYADVEMLRSLASLAAVSLGKASSIEKLKSY